MSKMSQYQQQILDDLAESFKERAVVGINKYGPDFVGDVVQHLWEESIDTTFYAGRVRQEYGVSLGHLLGGVEIRSTTTVIKNIHSIELEKSIASLNHALHSHNLQVSKIVLEATSG